MKLFRILSVLMIFGILASCEKETVVPDHLTKQEFELHIDFWNPNGNSPQISFDEVNSSPEVKIDFSQTFGGVALPPNFTNVIIENVRIIDDNNINYHIDRIKAYEWRDDINDWKVDVEFVMNYDQVQDLAVMIVLDASASLGEDFSTVKAYANDFIGKVFDQNPSAKIGIVDFSDEINTFGLTSNQSALASYIESIEQGPFTALYQAMSTGIGTLITTQAESKVLLTFTDGTDNNSGPAFTPNAILNQLGSDPSGVGISSFTIGLEGNGGVDKPVLELVSANSGDAAFPTGIEELGAVFDRFSESISTVYNLTYLRNQQIIPASEPAKLLFVLESSPKVL